MKEYIDREKLIENLAPILYEKGVVVNNTVSRIIYGIQCEDTADVVERSEYDKMIKYLKAQIKNKENNLRWNRDAFRRVVKRWDRLQRKIDKAYKEMEEFKKEVESINDLYAQSCVAQCIAILKENIGELKENVGENNNKNAK